MELLRLVRVGMNKELLGIRRRLYLLALCIGCQTVFYVVWTRVFPVGTPESRLLLYVLWTLVVAVVVPPVWIVAAELKMGSIQQQLVIPRLPLAVLVGRTLAFAVAGVCYVSVLMPMSLLIAGVTLGLSGAVYVVVGGLAVGAWGIAMIICSLVLRWRPFRYLSVLVSFMIIYCTSGLAKVEGMLLGVLELLPVLAPIQLASLLTSGQMGWGQVRDEGLDVMMLTGSVMWMLIGVVCMHVSVVYVSRQGRWPKGQSRLVMN